MTILIGRKCKDVSYMEATWLVDLDGVVWRGNSAIEGGSKAVKLLRAARKNVVFFTNNSFPTLASHISKLSSMGIDIASDSILTSAIAASHLLKEKSKVLCLGGPGLFEALNNDGHDAVLVHHLPIRTNSSDKNTISAAQFFSQSQNTSFRQLSVTRGQSFFLDQLTLLGNDLLDNIDKIEIGYFDVCMAGLDPFFNFLTLSFGLKALSQGSRLIATNDDMTYPMTNGRLPGGGSLFKILQEVAMVEGEVAGKPYQPAVDLVTSRFQNIECVVGDRIETDGLLAQNLGAKFALVYSGVTTHNMSSGFEPTYTGENFYKVVKHILDIED